jgi:hypothetical protein
VGYLASCLSGNPMPTRELMSYEGLMVVGRMKLKSCFLKACSLRGQEYYPPVDFARCMNTLTTPEKDITSTRMPLNLNFSMNSRMSLLSSV